MVAAFNLIHPLRLALRFPVEGEMLRFQIPATSRCQSAPMALGVGLGIAFGVGLGALFGGAVFDNPATGVAVGIAIGAAVGAQFKKR
ncbi:MAG: hypothetical protein ACK4P4_18270 [Allorhizobium sp.]